jgi:hypothetical protein
MVQHHRNIATEFFLNADRILWTQVNGGAIEMRFESRPIFGDPIHVTERKNLKAAAVGQDRAIPSHKSVKPSQFRDKIATRPKCEMIGVPEQYLGPGRNDLIDR